jgi:hypothetical protein
MTYSGVISPYQIICPHPQGLPIGPTPPQVEEVEEEKQDECKEDRHREDEGLVQLELRRFSRAVVRWIWRGTRHC